MLEADAYAYHHHNSAHNNNSTRHNNNSTHHNNRCDAPCNTPGCSYDNGACTALQVLI